jgi:peroxiredoxin
MLLVDGTGKIRAINQALMIDARLFGKLVEEVLLNLDGKEYARADSLKGKVTLLFVFIASSNAGCPDEYCGLRHLDPADERISKGVHAR